MQDSYVVEPSAEPTLSTYSVAEPKFFDRMSFNFKQRKNIQQAMQARYEKYGAVVRSGFLGFQLTQLFGPEWNQVVYQNRDGLFSSEEGWEFVLKRIFPGSIMAMDGADHLYQRRIMSQAFKRPKLVAYLDYMNPAVDAGLSHWLSDADASAQPFHVFPSVKSLTLKLATRVFMGIDLDEHANKMNQAFVDAVEASMAPIRYPIPPFQMWRGVKGRAYLVKAFEALLPEKRAKNTPDFFSQFCHAESDEGEKFTDQEIVDHMIFLMMAAHDTTTSTLTTMFYLLAKHPEWQDRLRDLSRSFNNPHLSFEEISDLEAFDWVMKECLRMVPPLPTMPRRVLKDATVMGVEFKQGSFVSVSPAHTHYMAEYWGDPDSFRPERFSSAEGGKRHPYQWIPFGGGAHMCVGQHFATLQVKAVLHQILLRFKWSVPEGYEVPYQLMPIAKPKDGLPVKLLRCS